VSASRACLGLIALIAALGLGLACADGDDQATVQLVVIGSREDSIAASYRAPCPTGICEASSVCAAADGTCSFAVETQSTVRLQARPATGRRFASWSGACSPVAGVPDSATLISTAHDVAQCRGEFAPVVTAGCNNPVVIEDDFEVDHGWTATWLPTEGVTASASHQTSGGNPDGYRQMQHIFKGGRGASIFVYHAFQATYDPSTQGTIDHVNYYEDQVLPNPPFAGAIVNTYFTMRQNRTPTIFVVRPPNAALANTEWERTSLLGLTAASAAPGVDFAGGPITFGYGRASSNTSLDAFTVTHGIDNFRVEICR